MVMVVVVVLISNDCLRIFRSIKSGLIWANSRNGGGSTGFGDRESGHDVFMII